MDDFDFAELMSEPPGGTNHGRKKTQAGNWYALEPLDSESMHVPVPSTPGEISSKAPAERRRHGSPSRYQRGCRCDECRSAWASYVLERRKNG